MVLFRLVIVLAVFYVIFAVLRSVIRGKFRKESRLKSEPGGEEMVFDPQCRSYIPVSDAVAQAGRYFCSRECARQYLSS